MTEVWEAGGSAIPVRVNGEAVGNASGTDTLGFIAQKFSNAHGLRTFNVLVNGMKADTSMGAKTLADLQATTIELVAKDARGQTGWVSE